MNERSEDARRTEDARTMWGPWALALGVGAVGVAAALKALAERRRSDRSAPRQQPDGPASRSERPSNGRRHR